MTEDISRKQPELARRESSPVRSSRPRPSARPARLMVGAGALAALTVISAGMVRFPVSGDGASIDASSAGLDQAGAGTNRKATAKTAAKGKTKAKAKAKATTKRPVRYVRLKPGQKAPEGAKVIREAAPTPRIVVRRSAPAPKRAKVRVVTRTRQSG